MMGKPGELRVHDITSSYRYIYNLKKKQKTQKQSCEMLLVFLLGLYTVTSACCYLPGALAFRQLVGQPVQTLVETRPLSGAGGLDVPLKRRQNAWDQSPASTLGKTKWRRT